MNKLVEFVRTLFAIKGVITFIAVGVVIFLLMLDKYNVVNVCDEATPENSCSTYWDILKVLLTSLA